LCGVNHSFMPIVVNAVSVEEYIAWIKKQSI
jgi:heme/copper-type cytochrome/quinol oxidase subunit 2